MESNLVKDVEGFVDKILPRDLPSDTREVAALAEEAKKYVVEIDPAFADVLSGLDSAYAAGKDALNVLAEKINAVKEAAKVKKAPVEVSTTEAPTTATPASSTAKPTFPAA